MRHPPKIVNVAQEPKILLAFPLGSNLGACRE
jgi:hypothetical protein